MAFRTVLGGRSCSTHFSILSHLKCRWGRRRLRRPLDEKLQIGSKWKCKSFILGSWGELHNHSGRQVSRTFRSFSPSWVQHLHTRLQREKQTSLQDQLRFCCWTGQHPLGQSQFWPLVKVISVLAPGSDCIKFYFPQVNLKRANATSRSCLLL